MTKKYEVVWANVANAGLVVIIQYIRTDNPTAAADNQRRLKARLQNQHVSHKKGVLFLNSSNKASSN